VVPPPWHACAALPWECFGQRQKAAAVSSGGVTSAQKTLLIVAAVLVGPAVLKTVYDKVTAETVDLSDFNIVTKYDTPAIEMMDDTVRIQFCAN